MIAALGDSCVIRANDGPAFMAYHANSLPSRVYARRASNAIRTASPASTVPIR
jgi:hypothetical protein